MNSRAEGKVNVLGKAEIISELNEWLENKEIDEILSEDDTNICYSGDCEMGCRAYTLHFPETDSVENIRRRLVADEKVTELIDLNALAEFMYNHIDVNSLMVLDNLALIYDEDGKISPAREVMENITGDEYAREACSDELGLTWVERQSVIINVSNLIEISERFAEDPQEIVSSDIIFREGFIQTLCHECRHLLYECNEIISIGDNTPYPALGGMEDAVEEYGNEEAERLFYNKEARNLINRLFSPEKEREKSLTAEKEDYRTDCLK